MFYPDENSVIAYVDGSVSSHKLGGAGARLVYVDNDGEETFRDSHKAGYRNVKSTQMEILACIFALEELENSGLLGVKTKIVIITDSKYVWENYKKAMFQWAKNGWKEYSDRPVTDARHWKELVKKLLDFQDLRIFPEIKWEKGDKSNPHIKAVHELAKATLRIPQDILPKTGAISITKPRIFSPQTRLEIGSVEMQGQNISIQILDCEYGEDKTWCIKYIVVTKSSRFFGSVDKIFSSESLDIGKLYYVRVNSITRNPRIVKVYREIIKMEIR